MYFSNIAIMIVHILSKFSAFNLVRKYVLRIDGCTPITDNIVDNPKLRVHALVYVLFERSLHVD